ncbi:MULTISPECIES: dihydrolipoyl dehydrogenase family protein [Cysteiniphilum]|uniref:dihydrolipoyl dehydrogenase family protein n=1 Tax=Cysteiniphilum TaxID=2056696 RepID=UPI00177D9CBC|nr:MULTISPECIES: FAD-dependent oxidoreductase [Cysteiniphilum]
MIRNIQTDICVIGGGSGGLSVAAGAAQMGAQVVLCEGGKMGGDCLNYGCVPSKALIEAARIQHHINKAPQFGVKAHGEVNFKAVHAHIHQVIATIEPHDSVERFESLGVQVINANARFINAKTVEAGEYRITAKYIVLATGSRARILPLTGLSEIDYLTNETIFDLTELPQYLVIVGAGPIGCELAQSYSLLGSQVTLLEAASEILGPADSDCKAIVMDEFVKLGIDVMTNVKIQSFSQDNNDIKYIDYEHNGQQKRLQASHVLMATGRMPNIEKLDLDKAGVVYSPHGVNVDKRLRTNHKHIYAIGDIASPLQFTHMAGYHAGIVIQNMLFKLPAKVDHSSFPWVTYTTPEIAHTGLAIKKAEKQGAQILQLSFADNDRAQASHATNGLIKVAVTSKGHILGVSIVGESAGELITPWTIAIKNKLKVKHMASFIAPYPTLSELSKRTAGSFYTPKLYSAKTRQFVRLLLKWF